MTTALDNRIKSLSVRLADRLDLAIELATLGGYGLEPIQAEAGCGQRDRQVAREVSTPARRGSCERPVRLIDAYAGAFCSGF